MSELQELFEQNQSGGRRYSKEEYAEYKKNERADLFDKVNRQTELVLTDDKALEDYLTLQSRMGKTSSINTLLIMAQQPDAQFLRSRKDWLQNNHAVKDNGKYIKTFELDGEYQRKDGTMAPNYRVARVYDVSQTHGAPIPERKPVPAMNALKAIMKDSPIPIGRDDKGLIKDGSAAMTIPDITDGKPAIYVSSDLIQSGDAQSAFQGIARELCTAEAGGNSFAGLCAAKMVCKKYGMDNSALTLPEHVKSMDGKEKRAFVNAVRSSALNVTERIDDNIQVERVQNRTAEYEARRAASQAQDKPAAAPDKAPSVGEKVTEAPDAKAQGAMTPGGIFVSNQAETDKGKAPDAKAPEAGKGKTSVKDKLAANQKAIDAKAAKSVPTKDKGAR
jgi:hypothetical protein